jgi:hypothetical protein
MLQSMSRPCSGYLSFFLSFPKQDCVHSQFYLLIKPTHTYTQAHIILVTTIWRIVPFIKLAPHYYGCISLIISGVDKTPPANPTARWSPEGQAGPQIYKILKFSVGFLRTRFRSSDTRQYAGSLSGNPGATSLMITAGSPTDYLRHCTGPKRSHYPVINCPHLWSSFRLTERVLLRPYQ